MGNVERRLADTFWDLRDDAHNHPVRWHGVTAEFLFQRLDEYVEAAEELGRSIDWQRDVADRLIAWRASEPDAS